MGIYKQWFFKSCSLSKILSVSNLGNFFIDGYLIYYLYSLNYFSDTPPKNKISFISQFLSIFDFVRSKVVSNPLSDFGKGVLCIFNLGFT